MKSINCVLLVIILCSGCAWRGSYSAAGAQQDPHLSDLIIGRWHGEFTKTDDKGDYTVDYWLEFVDPQVLVLSSRSPRFEEYNVVYRYSFIANDQISLQAREIDEWQITGGGEHLAIRSAHGLVPNGEYDRVATVPWLLVVLVLGILAGTTLLFLARSLKGYLPAQGVAHKDNVNDEMRREKSARLHRILVEMTKVVFFLGGMGASVILWGWRGLWQIRLPWDAVIMLEAALFLLGAGIILLSKYKTTSAMRLWCAERLPHYAGVFLIGSSMPGIGISFLKLALVIMFGSYGYGA
jgi:hypothetical protein